MMERQGYHPAVTSQCRRGPAVLLVLSLSMLSGAQAAEVQFHGTLIDNPPCNVGDGGPIEVEFGEVGITKIDGISYMKTIEVHLSCEDINGAAVYFTYAGMAASFDPEALQTSKSGLGIRLSHNTTVIPPGGGKEIPVPVGGMNTTVSFMAVPVKEGGRMLNEGPFTATATVEMRYP